MDCEAREAERASVVGAGPSRGGIQSVIGPWPWRLRSPRSGASPSLVIGPDGRGDFAE